MIRAHRVRRPRHLPVWLIVAGGVAVAIAGLADALPTPLTQETGDAERGKQIVIDRELGHCVLCHQIGQLDAPFQGNLGPELTNVGERLSAPAIRQQIIDPTVINPNSVMPAYFRADGLTQVAPAYRGQTVLTAQQVEDVVAYLLTLKANEDAN